VGFSKIVFLGRFFLGLFLGLGFGGIFSPVVCQEEQFAYQGHRKTKVSSAVGAGQFEPVSFSSGRGFARLRWQRFLARGGVLYLRGRRRSLALEIVSLWSSKLSLLESKFLAGFPTFKAFQKEIFKKRRREGPLPPRGLPL